MYNRENYGNVKHETLDSLDRYATGGVPPGGFLTAVLENNLMESQGRADLQNRLTLYDITKYVYNEMPMGCHGKAGIVEEWCKEIRLQKEAEEFTHSMTTSEEECQKCDVPDCDVRKAEYAWKEGD